MYPIRYSLYLYNYSSLILIVHVRVLYSRAEQFSEAVY